MMSRNPHTVILNEVKDLKSPSSSTDQLFQNAHTSLPQGTPPLRGGVISTERM
jgi:hypothetical protein